MFVHPMPHVVRCGSHHRIDGVPKGALEVVPHHPAVGFQVADNPLDPHSVKYRAITRHITPLPAQTSRPPEAVASSVYPAALSSFGRLCSTNTYEQNCQSSESKLSLLGVCRVVKVVDEVNSQTPFKTLPSMPKLTPFQRRYPAGQDQTPHCNTSP